MRVVIINKSDSTGGAAIVSRRLLEALLQQGVDARMLVAEKLTDSPRIELAAPAFIIKEKFIAERLRIYCENGFNRSTLFKIDTAGEGLPLWRHPRVLEADVIMLNWVNQGMLSIKGIEKICNLGKPVIWTMHDMWNMTGICHHAGICSRYQSLCSNCPLLGKKGKPKDLSTRIFGRKQQLYNSSGRSGQEPGKRPVTFVAVSHWLAEKAAGSVLLKNQEVRVIPNALPINATLPDIKERNIIDRIKILFGAARLDDPIKGLPKVIAMTRELKENYPEVAARVELHTFGGIKEPLLLDQMAVKTVNHGMLHGEESLRSLYADADMIISASDYETLPTTLMEAQLYGAITIAFDSGGQKDIIDSGKNGLLLEPPDNIEDAGRLLARSVNDIIAIIDSPGRREYLQNMRQSVLSKFSPEKVAGQYIALMKELL